MQAHKHAKRRVHPEKRRHSSIPVKARALLVGGSMEAVGQSCLAAGHGELTSWSMAATLIALSCLVSFWRSSRISSAAAAGLFSELCGVTWALHAWQTDSLVGAGRQHHHSPATNLQNA